MLHNRPTINPRVLLLVIAMAVSPAACGDDASNASETSSTMSGSSDATLTAAGSTSDVGSSTNDTDPAGGTSTSTGSDTTTGSDTGTSSTGTSDSDATATATTGPLECPFVEVPPTVCGAAKDSPTNGSNTAWAIPAPVTHGGNPSCDMFLQDCGNGEKCVPVTVDGAVYTLECQPVAARALAIGEPCSNENGDPCGDNAACFGATNQDPNGVCAELCGCNAETPTCEGENTFCALFTRDTAAFCVPSCNPLDIEATCNAGLGCYPVRGNDFFGCMPDGSDGTGAPGEACMFGNDCVPGAFCITGALVPVPSCDGSGGCCTSLCTLGDDDACLPSQGCRDLTGGTPPDICLAELGACVNVE